jgi:hypothetical protein
VSHQSHACRSGPSRTRDFLSRCLQCKAFFRIQRRLTSTNASSSLSRNPELLLLINFERPTMAAGDESVAAPANGTCRSPLFGHVLRANNSSDAASKESESDSPLLRLAPELRNRIYDFVFEDAELEDEIELLNAIV